MSSVNKAMPYAMNKTESANFDALNRVLSAFGLATHGEYPTFQVLHCAGNYWVDLDDDRVSAGIFMHLWLAAQESGWLVNIETDVDDTSGSEIRYSLSSVVHPKGAADICVEQAPTLILAMVWFLDDVLRQKKEK